MPELPEVEACRYHLEQYCLHAVIIDVLIRESGGGPRNGLFDDIIFDTTNNLTQQSYINSLLNRKLAGVHRKGKNIWMTFDAKVDSTLSNDVILYDAVLLHFGMTGSIVVKDNFVPVYKSFDVSQDQWPPRFTKLELIFQTSSGEKVHVSFADPRRLGRICLRNDPLSCPPISLLGLDLTTELSYDVDGISTKILASSRPIKVLLLDQEKVFCGIGNWIADEVLYQAGIHPEIKSSSLTKQQIIDMIDKLKYIFTHAVTCLCSNRSYPDDWLFNYRWDKRNAKAVKGGLSMPDGSRIEFIEVGGRTSAIVPSKLYKKVTAKTVHTAVIVDGNKDDNMVVKSRKKVKASIEFKDEVSIQPIKKSRRHP